VVPGLVLGIQGFKNPGSLGKTWDQEIPQIYSNRLKFFAIPCPETSRHAGVSPVFSKNFSFFKKVFFEGHPPGLPRGTEDEGARESLLPAPKCVYREREKEREKERKNRENFFFVRKKELPPK
jgi:hypothetical protein